LTRLKNEGRVALPEASTEDEGWRMMMRSIRFDEGERIARPVRDHFTVI
jgi:hypothetical protein